MKQKKHTQQLYRNTKTEYGKNHTWLFHAHTHTHPNTIVNTHTEANRERDKNSVWFNERDRDR